MRKRSMMFEACQPSIKNVEASSQVGRSFSLVSMFGLLTRDQMTMRQKLVRKRHQMNSAAFIVEDTRKRLSQLVECESRGHGDADNALRRIARNLDLSYSYLWRILHRRENGVKDIAGSVLLTIHIAHEAMLDARRRDEAKTDQTSRLGAFLTRVAHTIAGEQDRAEEEGRLK